MTTYNTAAGLRGVALRGAAVMSALALAFSTAIGLPTATADPAPTAATTSEKEARRVDSVATPELSWVRCARFPQYQCADVQLPLDYDKPDGEKITVSMLKVPAQSDKRIGSLFINPGGPGGSGKEFAAYAEDLFERELLDHFDIIGMDPRGIGDSTALNCFPDTEQGVKDLTPSWEMVFPTNDEEVKVFQASVRKLGEACAANRKDLASAISTAQVARDMDVLRRALGDEKMNFLGYSYGSYLGQVYANMFPDRIRALAIDGILNPTEWLGTAATATVPFGIRVDSGSGADYAITRLMRLCAKSDECPLDEPQKSLDGVVAQLKREPVTFPMSDGSTQEITYQRFTSLMLGMLYSASEVEEIPELIGIVEQLGNPEDLSKAQQLQFGRAFIAVETQAEQAIEESPTQLPVPPGKRNAAALTAESGTMSVICSEGSHPSERVMRREAASYAQDSPYFGPHWYWAEAACARPGWKARDEDSYRGPFNQVTSAPILVIGNKYDPSTNVGNAYEVARLLPNSRLVISNNWGHIAYFESQCARSTANAYLLDPAGGAYLECKDGAQPFA